jgi:hypothetical protein
MAVNQNKTEGEDVVTDQENDEFEKERLGREHLIELIHRISDESFTTDELDDIQKQAAEEARKYTLGAFRDIETPTEEEINATFNAFFDGYCLKAGYTYHDE